MKILMVNKFLYPKGGAETYFLKIGKYYEENGHEVEYFGMYDEKNTVFNNCGMYTQNMDFHSKGIKRFFYPFKIIYSKEAKKKIKKVLKDFKPDIVHLNNINFQLTPAIIDEINKQKIPVIQTVHDYQMLCPNHLMFDLEQKPCEKCLHGSKMNCAKGNCIHGSKVKSIIGSLEAILYKKKKTYEKVNYYVCPSNFIEKKLLEVPLYNGKTCTIHNFIEQIKDSGEVKKEDYVLFFGRLSEEKGYEMFLQCCRELPEIKFIVAGTGPMEKMCCDISNVEYVGFKTGKELDELISKAKFSVYPSIWYENCPLSVLESQSLLTPVIASNMGGIPELIKDGETGVILKDLSKDELKKEINTLYNDENMLNHYIEGCKNLRNELVTLDFYCEKLMKVYENVINNY